MEPMPKSARARKIAARSKRKQPITWVSREELNRILTAHLESATPAATGGTPATGSVRPPAA